MFYNSHPSIFDSSEQSLKVSFKSCLAIIGEQFSVFNGIVFYLIDCSNCIYLNFESSKSQTGGMGDGKYNMILMLLYCSLFLAKMQETYLTYIIRIVVA